jgi:UDP-N-acetylmuramoyl-tripeptide--D-alanyl-D-alanine ligase
MKEIAVKDLATIIRAAQNAALPDVLVTGISIDSRTTRPGDCFFAIPGENFDGHDYITQAFEKGAPCAVIRKDIPGAKGLILKVDDTITALGALAAWYRSRMKFTVIAITGSVGKTTTRHIIAHVLAARFRVFQAPKNFNNNIGLPLTLLGADQDHQVIVAEIGTNHPGEIEPLTRIASPDIAVITNVYPAHLAGLGSLDAIIKEKFAISRGLRPGGLMVVNGRFQPLIDDCTNARLGFITFGQADSCDIKAQNVACSDLGSTFTIDAVPVSLPLPGPGNIENTLAAWAVCRQLGLTITDFAHALSTITPPPMRAEMLHIANIIVISDCYNANPASMQNALHILGNFAGRHPDRRPVFICGDMAELAEQTENLHAQLGRSIARTNLRLLITVGPAARIVAHTAQKYADNALHVESFEDTLDACNGLKKLIKDYDVILVKGSRAAGLESVVQKLTELFSSKTAGRDEPCLHERC